MTLSRGQFLKICGTALLGGRVDAWPGLAGFLAGGDAAAPVDSMPGRLRVQDACASQFRPHLNTTFAAGSADGVPLRLVLAHITEQPITGGVEQFSLIFHGPPAAPVAHGIQTFRHPVLGDFDLFIAPVGRPNVRRTVYEACFSRHVSPGEHRARLGTERPAPLEDTGCRIPSSDKSC